MSAAYAQRLAWLTGFGGSAGTAAVLTDKAAIFIDGRYTLQVRDQVDGRLYAYEKRARRPAWPPGWRTTPRRARDRLRSVAARQGLGRCRQGAARKGGRWSPVEGNPIDAIWADRPAPSLAPALVHPLEHAGKSSEAKRAEVAEWLAARGLDAAVISALDSSPGCSTCAGADVERTPVTLSFVLAHADGTADLFIAEEKVTPELRAHLGNAVRSMPARGFVPALGAGGQARSRSIPNARSRRCSPRWKGRARKWSS
jgi:Xaa-Pro aminopeptidase